MTADLMAMLLGVFIVPVLLLWAGHRLRRRTPRMRRAFWGGVIGHIIALVIGSIAAMITPAAWDAGDTWRGLFGLWSFLLLPAIGATIAAFGSGSTATGRR
ncbi:MAG: hypothetical protein V4617_19035 [Gemmatimonadota bacterium]